MGTHFAYLAESRVSRAARRDTGLLANLGYDIVDGPAGWQGTFRLWPDQCR